uniref:Transcription factor 25 n=1 Tax=Steinernema glaseri TaxID=37863 RepID=A0A1I8AKY5_9BILA
MSSKHLRMKLLEKEENGNEVEESSGEEEEQQTRKAPINRFAALGLMEDDDDEEEEEKPSEVNPAPVSSAATEKKRKKNKNRKNKKKTNKKNDEDEERAPEGDDETETLSAADAKERAKLYARYLAVDAQGVNAENEMKRLLGKAFGAASGGNNSKRRNATFVPGRIVKAKPNWPPLVAGLGTEVVREENGTTWFKFVHNNNYRELQQLFWAGEKSYDHSLIQMILQQNPFHLDSLLITANMMRVQEDVQVARDLIERGVYACDMSTNAPFFIFDPNHRLDYHQRENRAFFLLLHRLMRNAGDRRCFYTALQLCKLILLKDPDGDELATLLEIDTWALKAKEYWYVIDLFDNFTHKRMDLLPNFLYSVALAYFRLGEGYEQKASEALQRALLSFPTVLTQLLDKMGIQPDKSIDNNTEMNAFAHDKMTPGFKMLSDIYVHHSHELWKEPEVLAWLEAESTKIVPRFSKELKKEFREKKELMSRRFLGIPFNIMRHAVIYEITTSGDRIITDPVPPLPEKSLEDYPMILVAEEPQHIDDGFIAGFLNSLLPGYDGTESLSDQVNAIVARLGDAVNSFIPTRGAATEEQGREPDGNPERDEHQGGRDN